MDPVLMSAGGHKNRLITNQTQKSRKPKPIHSLLFFETLQVSQAPTDPGSDLTCSVLPPLAGGGDPGGPVCSPEKSVPFISEVLFVPPCRDEETDRVGGSGGIAAAAAGRGR